jgi:RNA polymerase sigma-70 factor (ECF subfamily)
MPAVSLAELRDARQRFLELVADLRPDLHRYCARMTGSVSDGEDVVQDALARAYYALAELDEMPDLRPWLFRIAHHRAIDHLRRAEHRRTTPLEIVADDAIDQRPLADDALARADGVRLALARFLELPPGPRSAVILKDVLGHSLEEIAELLDLGVPAVKAALHRGRARVAALSIEPAPAVASGPPSPLVTRYVALFNARDWDGVRTLLADDVRLDLVARARRRGRAVGDYFTNYDRQVDWHLAPARHAGREVVAVLAGPGGPPIYLVELTFADGAITLIRDYRYARDVLDAAALQLGG